jgi:hypothetical protein
MGLRKERGKFSGSWSFSRFRGIPAALPMSLSKIVFHRAGRSIDPALALSSGTGRGFRDL